MVKLTCNNIHKMRSAWIGSRRVFRVVCGLILVWISFTTFVPSAVMQSKSRNIEENVIQSRHLQRHFPRLNTTNVTPFSTDLIDKIKSVAKLIHDAKKHVRGSKTSDLLKQATETMTSILGDINIDSGELYNRKIYEPVTVCPEKYMGTTYGYPYFYKGFETTVCDHGVPIWKLVSIVKHINDLSDNLNFTITSITKFVSSVYKLNSNFNVKISTNNPKVVMNLKKLFPSLTVIYSEGHQDGTALNLMIRDVQTPYVLVARDVEFITNDSRLERLIRETESLKVKVAGGAVRNPDGHWKKGCFQSVYRNFTLRYLEGYDESIHECLFCDFIQGPFVAAKTFLEENTFGNYTLSEGLFEDWFLRITSKGDEVIVCPDSMFHVVQTESAQRNHTWANFMKNWELIKMITPCGNTIKQTCSGKKIASRASKMLSPCSVQSNADAVNTIMKVCEDANIVCELQEGTALGAVKLSKTLPWERDADLTFLTSNYSSFSKLQSAFRKRGFSFSDLGSTWCCVDNRTAGGKFKIGYMGWSVELYGQHIMDSERMIEEGMKPSKVLLDGQWVNMPRNPGLFVRNRYGREIYQHAEHWMTTGDKSGWINYKTNVFKPCVNKGGHDCLDRYNADGDLPFIEMLP